MFRKAIEKTLGSFLKPNQKILNDYREAKRMYDLGEKQKALNMFEDIISRDASFKQARAQIGKISGELRNEQNNQPDSSTPKLK